MENPFRFADELGPEKVVHLYEPRCGLRAVVVVDNTAAGPAIGGARMALDVSTEECFRLARAMTLKNAAAGLAHGGGKSVIFGDPKCALADKERIIRAFARAIEHLDEYIVGPDMGTNETCMAWVHDEIGRSVGLPPELGGIPLDEVGATGFGLAASIDEAKEHARLELKGARVVVQGFGAVGIHAARFLAEKGCVLVGAADSRGSVYDPKGLSIEALVALKRRDRSVNEHDRGERGGPERVLDMPCEIWIPAARPDVLTAANVDRLQAKIVAQGANIPATPEAEARLHQKGILVLPDFIANAGGVICAAVEYHGGSRTAAFASIDEKIRANTRAMLARVREGEAPRAAALAIAGERVRKAMSMRRRF